MNRDEWLRFRLSGVGASEGAACLWANPLSSPLDVRRSKLGVEDDFETSEHTHWGQIAEDLIASEVARRTGWRLTDPGRHASRQHSRIPYLFATADRLIGSTGVLECKFTEESWMDKWLVGAPVYYVIQLQIQMDVYDRQWGVVAGLVGKNLRCFAYQRNDVFIKRMHRALRRFWRGDETRSVAYILAARKAVAALKRTPPHRVARFVC